MAIAGMLAAAVAFSAPGDTARAGQAPDAAPTRSVGSLAVQADGKVLAAGRGRSSFVVRYTRRGKVDRGFGTRGRADLPAAVEQATIGSVALQSDGRIVLSARTDSDSYLFRLTRQGRLDTGFGSGGTVQTSDSDFVADAGPGGLVVSPDDQLLVSEYSRDSGDHVVAAARYLPGGDPDPGFAGDGRAERDLGPALAAAVGPGLEATRSDGVALTPGGAVTVIGHALFSGPSNYTVAVRFSSSGAPDASYGDDGVGVALTRIAEIDDVATSRSHVAVLGLIVDPNATHGCCRDALPSFDSQGGLDDRFDPSGLGRSQGGEIAADRGGTLFFAGTESAPYGRSGRDRMRVSSYASSGDLRRRFSDHGTTALRVSGLATSAEAVAADGAGGAYVGGGVVRGCRPSKCSATVIVHLDRHGRLDASFGRGGVVTSPRLRR